MDDKVLAVLISSVVSGLVAWLISWMKINSEIRKLRYDMNAKSAETINKLRLENYSEAYKLIQGYIKGIQRKGVSPEMARDAFANLDEWQTENGYLLSSEASTIFYSFLRKMRRITEASDQAFLERVHDNDKRTEMIREAFSVELALKNDLGIFVVEYFDPKLKIRSYQELDEILEREKA